ncbi:hypothetical protein SAMN04487783_1189 [Agrococcus baldri]|uniref:Uncharacterized protein n=1 Tax=Agrococcus baldri TaxID=153730 RepID=A0AA94KZG3_9MICO|nr:hypothetical protein [Agrococcus baldri]SFS08974.1 hypothetical protein SAMN04487783_1189 [Agrococcus baldri]
MSDTSHDFEEAAVPEHARPVHPDGQVDEPVDDVGVPEGSPQHGGTTGAEHDGGAEQIAAEAQDATDALDGASPQGASEPVDGAAGDPVAGSGSPVEGAGS